MRRGRAIVFATAFELLCEPVFLLVLLAALALSVLAPAMHYHQFGEASRMARDAGISAMLVGGFAVCLLGPVKTFRRELETGTAQVALAHSVSRTSFFVCKALGCLLAYVIFTAAISLTTLTVVNGAEIGGAIAAARGGMARLWGPSFACAMSAIVLPLVFGAVLNRFLRFRFVLSANLLVLTFAFIGSIYRFDGHLAARLLPVLALASAPACAVLAASAAFSVRFRGNVATASSAVVAALLLPILGNYCLSDALAYGGILPTGYVLAAFVAFSPVVAAFVLAGVHFINVQDVQ
jgi:hypothetical protein